MQQEIYSREQHGISVDQIDRDALYVMQKLTHAGFVAYLVGGGVRDLLLNRKPKDFDISTSAEPEEIKKLFRNCILIGRRFRLAHIRFGKKVLEVSTFRSGDVLSDTLIIRDNVWGTEEEDVLRRDFTINGLFYDPETQTIIDYVGGYADIERKVLRTIGQPFLRFKQDPVRMIRLIKFQARFGLEVDPETQVALVETRHEILKSSTARIFEELLRMLESGAAQAFFRLMTDEGMLQLMMPALSNFLETSEGDEVYSYLQEIDTFSRDPEQEAFDRSILLGALVFSMLQKRIQTRFVDRGHFPHLGQIQMEAHDLLDELFLPFFQIPRRMRGCMVSLLTSQFRLTPLEKRHTRRIRIPNDPDFPLALKFLQLRCCLEPGLKTILEEWSNAFTQPDRPIAKRRRRKRRRKPADGA